MDLSVRLPWKALGDATDRIFAIAKSGRCWHRATKPMISTCCRRSASAGPHVIYSRGVGSLTFPGVSSRY